MRFWDHYCLQTAKQIWNLFPKQIYYHACLDCFSPFLNFYKKKKKNLCLLEFSASPQLKRSRKEGRVELDSFLYLFHHMVGMKMRISDGGAIHLHFDLQEGEGGNV